MKKILGFLLLMLPTLAFGQASGLPAPSLTNTPTLCPVGQAPTGVNVFGNAIGCASMGGTGGVQYNAPGTNNIFVGNSANADDNNLLGPLVTVTGVTWSSVSSNEVCVFTNSGVNGFAANDWFDAGQITSPTFFGATGFSPLGPASNGIVLLQVLATGLSTTQFEANCPHATPASGSGTGGKVEVANNYLAYYTSRNEPFYAGHGVPTILQCKDGTGQDDIPCYNRNFAAIFNPYAPGTTGQACFIHLIDYGNSVPNLVTTEGYLQTFWANAHSIGCKVVQGTGWPLSTMIDGTVLLLGQWLGGQACTQNGNTTQCWDRIADYSPLLPRIGNFIAGNGGFDVQGIPIAANELNKAMSEQQGNISTMTQMGFGFRRSQVAFTDVQNFGVPFVALDSAQNVYFSLSAGTDSIALPGIAAGCLFTQSFGGSVSSTGVLCVTATTYAGTGTPAGACNSTNIGTFAINATPRAYQCSNATGSYLWNTLSPPASAFLTAETGSLTAIIANGQYGPAKIVRAGTLENIEGLSSSFTCPTPPTFTLEDCGATAGVCGAPTALGSVTITAAGTTVDGTITSATLTAGHYLVWETTAGVCTAVNIDASAEYRMN